MRNCGRKECAFNYSSICNREEGLCFHVVKVAKENIQLKPNYLDQYFYVDLASENLFEVATWLNDATDWHMLKLGLICNSPKDCVLKAKVMLNKLGLIDLV